MHHELNPVDYAVTNITMLAAVLTMKNIHRCKSVTATRIRIWVSHLQDRRANHYTTAAYTTQHLVQSGSLIYIMR